MFTTINQYLYASYYCEDDRLRYPTGIKASDTSPGATLKKEKIRRIITQYVANCEILERPVFKPELKAHLDIELGKKVKRKYDFWENWDEDIADMRSGELLKSNGERYKEPTADHYKYTKVALQRFEKGTNVKMSYQFSIDQYRQMISYFVKEDASKNTIAGYVRDLHSFLSRHHSKRHNNKIIYNKEFKFSGEDADNIALNVKEITSLFYLYLTGAEERARDAIVFACWVGLRDEDLSRINDYKRRGDLIDVLTSKTGETVVIPLHWMAKAIMDKYGDGKLPVYTTSEGLAYHLPTICRKAGIISKHLIVITKGGVKQEKYYEKCDLVSPHTARRSFATNMYKAGFSIKSIMKITGHKKESTFLNYVKIDKEENAEEIAASPFFKGPTA